jgi:uncharacterized repeat protein (TIGR02543 family)
MKIRNKMLSLLLAAVLILTLFPGVALTAQAATFSSCSGSGSSTDPYVIINAAQLTELAAEVNNGTSTFSGSYFALGNNLTDIGSWTPIGSQYCSFDGTFDGKGYTISGLSIGSNTQYNSSYSFAGLFGNVSSSATIKNLNLNVSIYSAASDSSIGALAGYSDGKIINCTSSGTISVSGSYVGGLVGYANSGSIIGCSSSCTVTDTADGTYVGGLIGESYSGVSVNSYATGNVTAGNSGYVGGFAGQNYSALNCYSTGSVTTSGEMSAALAVGAFAGIDASGYVFNCYSSSSVSVSALASSSANTIYIGGFDGIEQATYMSNCFSSTGTISAPSGITNVTVYAGGFTGELSGNYTNCYYNSLLGSTANGVTNSGTGSATALSAAVFGATATISITYTTDGSTTATATTLVDALNGGNAVFSGSATSPSAILSSSPFSGYTPMHWENGTAGHPVYTSLWQTNVTLTSVTLKFASPFSSNSSTAVYKDSGSTASSGTDITSDPNTATSGDAVTISGLTPSTTYYYNIVFTNSSGDTYTSEVVIAKTASVNHAPTLSVTTDAGLIFSPDDTGTCPFTNVTVGVGDGDGSDSQHISSITLTVTGIKNGDDECLIIDGNTKIYLYNTSINTKNYTTENEFTVSVENNDGASATVTISKSSASLSVWQEMLKGIYYKNNNTTTPRFGKRIVTITGITDDGGTLYGTNSATCSYESDVIVAYRITYVMGIPGATNPNPAWYDSTTAITLASPTATGYTFEGWYTDAGLIVPASSPAIAVGKTGNYTFYAKWTAYPVTIQNDGNGTASANAASASSGTGITLTATPNNGYHFKEWQVVSGGVTVSDSKFTMPNNEVTIKAVFEADVPVTHSITVQNDGNGTASANIASAVAGTEITLTATPNNGYHFKEWQVVSGGVTVSDSKFIMPDNEVTIKAVFEADMPDTYSVTVQNDGNGTASANVTSTVAGTEITLTAAPNNGYHFKEWQVVSGGITVSSSKFTMPDNAVTVKAIFEVNAPDTYSVTVQNDGNGTANANVASAVAGTEITLTATPNDGYYFKEWQVISGGVTISSSKFTMPGNAVTVKAIFKKNSISGITGFQKLDDAIRNQTVAVGTTIESLNLPQKLQVIGNGITGLCVKVSKWVCSLFNSSVAGTYTFTPMLNNRYVDSGYVDSGYVLDSGVKLPEIKVTMATSSDGSKSDRHSEKNSAPSLPSVLKDIPTSMEADLTGAAFPSGVTKITLSATQAAQCGANDPQVANTLKLAISDAKLNVIGTPIVYDLKLLDQNGNPITGFSGKVKVKIPIPLGTIGELHVFRYEESTGAFTDMGATAEDGFLVFETDHFSYYTVAGVGDSITLDTRSYQMPIKGQYQIGLKLTGSKAATVKVYSTNDRIATTAKLINGNVQVTGAGNGTAYIMINVYDSKNKFLTHASVRVDVKTGIRPRGDSTRQFGVF